MTKHYSGFNTRENIVLDDYELFCQEKNQNEVA
jgi:hypothetical protein